MLILDHSIVNCNTLQKIIHVLFSVKLMKREIIHVLLEGTNEKGN